MLNASDIYVSGGSNPLYGCWTDKVTKFDTSSFYNWEQDNLPVLDLEERTYLLWERLGNPLSSLTGMSFVVSADTVSSCYPTHFTSLSACLEALPEVINHPILIEVASFGNLGNLKLSNKIFGPRGALEIVNRNSGEGHGLEEITGHNNIQIAEEGNAYFLASATSSSGGGLPGIVPDLLYELSSSKIYSTGENIFSASPESRHVDNLTLFSRIFRTDFNTRMTAAIAAKNSTAMTSTYTAPYKIEFEPYESNSAWQDEDQGNLYDPSCINELAGGEIIWGTGGSTPNEFVGIAAYLNTLSKIEVVNCNGPIYIRNFVVDGGGLSSVTETGIHIENSKVVLDKCAATRCRGSGLKASNSDVTLTRGFVAYRNYPYKNDGSRVGEEWLNKINNNISPSSLGAGIRLENSNLNVSTNYTRDRFLFSSIYAGASSVFPAASWLYCLSQNDVGLMATNSKITGGRTELGGAAAIGYYDSTQFITELNREAGVKLVNSTFENSGKLYMFGNYRGLDAESSIIKLDTTKATHNQKEAIKLVNSQLTYNKDLYSIYFDKSTFTEPANAHQVSIVNNGTSIRLVNSKFEPTYTSGMDSLYERFFVSGNFGINQDLNNQESKLPAVILESGSRLDAIHASFAPAQGSDDTGAVYGDAVAAHDGSEVILRGTSTWPTKILGPDTLSQQQKKSGLYANNGSVIKLQGPTVIAKYGVNALADNNSKIEITPHRNSDGSLLVSSFSLETPGNQTQVELHSTRACLVADHGSVILMEDVGDHLDRWNAGSYGASVVLSGLDYLTNAASLNTQLYTSAGHVQFYPNPNDTDYYAGILPATVTVPTYALNLYTKDNFSTGATWPWFLQDYAGSTDSFSATTTGGMCVRVLNQSKANINNVHFPCGWWNASAVIYDVSAANPDDVFCNRLFIWNIADNSQINAKYVSVSGTHPRDAGYVGPSGVWNSVSGAPAGTPDTGSVPVLDYYGQTTDHIYGKSTAENFGPFRLFFSIDPAANWLQTSALGLSGYVPQVFSQGYNFSGDLIAPGTVSAQYTSLLKNNAGTLEASGFYFTSSMVFSPNTFKAILDDSAGNTFANAKHNTVGKSGLAKLVSIYYPWTDTFGGDSADGTTKSQGSGRGVRSVNNFDLEKDN